MAALAYADDVCLLAHSAQDLQILFSTFETAALKTGLKVNMGKGKTERVAENSPAGVVMNAAGAPIPVVTNYKYLGVLAFDWNEDFAARRRKAWSALTKFTGIWKSNLLMDTKRNLFQSLVEPIFSYGLHAWALTVAKRAQLNGTYGRMLRFALGLPPAFISRDVVGTEKLYGDLPFISCLIEKRTFTLLGHTLREHLRGTRVHQYATILLFDPKEIYPKKRNAPRITVVSRILRNCKIEFVEQLSTLVQNRSTCRKVAHDILLTHQNEENLRRVRRRIKDTLRTYFGLSARQIPATPIQDPQSK
eukprot:PhF_6_TR5579/c2_g2_i6/m.7990